jgi:hypothetical protein
MRSTRERPSDEGNAPPHAGRADPVGPWPLDRLRAGRRADRGRARRRFRPLRRRDAGDRRRERLGQVGHGALDRAASARQRRHQRIGALPRHRDDGRRRANPAPRARQRHQLHLPGADDLAEPVAHHRPPARREPRAAPGPRRQQGERAHPRTARPGRHPRPRDPPRRLSPPALGRPAPARDDRDGARQQSRRADRRRADHRARRDDPGADPRPARRFAAPARHGDAVHHP